MKKQMKDKMKCPYCKEELYFSDKNLNGKDVYECMRDNRLFVVPIGSTSLLPCLKEHWIQSVLSNDEYASDEELVDYFMHEGGLTSEEAQAWVAKRDFYLNNIVMDDGTVYKPRKDLEK